MDIRAMCGKGGGNKNIVLCNPFREVSHLTLSLLQFYLVMKGHGKNEDTSLTSKNGPGKFVAAKIRAAHTSLSQQSNPQQNTTNIPSDGSKLTEKDVQVTFLALEKI